MGSEIAIASQTAQQQDLPSRLKSNHFNTYFRDYCQISFQPTRNNDQQTRKTVIRRHIILEDNNELEQFYKKYVQTQKIPFNIIYPNQVTRWNRTSSELDSVIENRPKGFLSNISDSTEKFCLKSSIASVYFQPFMINLLDFCINRSKHSLRTKRISTLSSNIPQVKGLFDHQGLQQNQIWFIINEISHSIATLKQHKHAHWNINPQTIFCNSIQNWFIHDSYFVFGPNYQNFLQYKLRLIRSTESKNLRQSATTLKGNSLVGKGQMLFMSEQLMKRVQKGIHIDFQSGCCEDIFGLGNSILFAMGIPIEILAQKDPLNRFKNSINFLTFDRAIGQRYSEDLLNIVGYMIEPFQNKRITINRLREKLSPKEKKIICQSISELRNNGKSLNRLQYKQKNSANTIEMKRNSNFADRHFKNTNKAQNYRVEYPHVQSQEIIEPVSTSLMIEYIDNLPIKGQTNLQRVQSQKSFSSYNLIGKQFTNKHPKNQSGYSKPGIKQFTQLPRLK